MSKNARITNETEFKKQLERDKRRVKRAVHAAVDSGLQLIKNDAQDKAPYRTGNLRRSITTEVDIANNRVEGWVGTDVEYAPSIEYGQDPFWLDMPVKIPNVGWRYIKEHPGHKPIPFLRPAFDANKEIAIQEIKESLGKILSK
jgi:HK97 gp10 family phage protein